MSAHKTTELDIYYQLADALFKTNKYSGYSRYMRKHYFNDTDTLVLIDGLLDGAMFFHNLKGEYKYSIYKEWVKFK